MPHRCGTAPTTAGRRLSRPQFCFLPLKEKTKAGLPLFLLLYAVEQLVVAAAVPLEEQAQLKQRLLEHAGLNQHQHDQQPAHAAAAIEKRVDLLKLQADQREADLCSRKHTNRELAWLNCEGKN
jgi:hypothetical protein